MELDVHQFLGENPDPPDWAPIIDAAIASVPSIQLDGGACAQYGGWPRRGAIIRFPSRETPYRLSRGIIVPASKAIAFTGDPSGGSVLWLDADAPVASGEPEIVAPLSLPPSLADSPDTWLDFTESNPQGYDKSWEALWSDYLERVTSEVIFYLSGLNEYSELLPAKVQLSPFWKERGVLLPGNGESPFSIEDLVLIGGGILIAGGGRRFRSAGGSSGGRTRFGAVRRCTIRGAAAAVRAEDQRVINVEVSDCDIIDCGDGVSVGFAQSDIWMVRDCHFESNSGVDLRIGSSAVHAEGCVFQGKKPGSLAPYVHLVEGPAESDPVPVSYRETDGTRHAWFRSVVQLGRGNRLTGCVFGSTGAAPPRDLIVMGPLGDDTYTARRHPEVPPITSESGSVESVKGLVANDVLFDACQFGGLDHDSRSAVVASAALQSVAFTGGLTGRLSTFIQEQAVRRATEDGLVLAAYLKVVGNPDAVADLVQPDAPLRRLQERVSLVSRASDWVTSALLTPLSPLDDWFTEGGRGVEVRGTHLRSVAGRAVQNAGRHPNLLNQTDVTRWDSSELQDSPAAPAPLGTGLPGLELSSSTIHTNLPVLSPRLTMFPKEVGYLGGLLLRPNGAAAYRGPCLFSAWLGAGTSRRALLNVGAGAIGIGGPAHTNALLRLPPVWYRATLLIPRLPRGYWPEKLPPAFSEQWSTQGMTPAPPPSAGGDVGGLLEPVVPCGPVDADFRLPCRSRG